MHISPYPNRISFGDIPFLTQILPLARQVQMLEERFDLKFALKPSESQPMGSLKNKDNKGALFLIGYGIIGFQTEKGKEYFFDTIQKIGESDIQGEGTSKNIIIEIKDTFYLYRVIQGDYRHLEWIPNNQGKEKYFPSIGAAKVGMRLYINALTVNNIVTESGRNFQ